MLTKRVQQALFLKNVTRFNKITVEHKNVQSFSSCAAVLACKNVIVMKRNCVSPATHVFLSTNGFKYGIERNCHQTVGKKKEEEEEFELEEIIDKNEAFVTNPEKELNEATWTRQALETLPGYRDTVRLPLMPKSVSADEAENLLASNWEIMSSAELTKNFETVSFYINNQTEDFPSSKFEHVLQSVGQSASSLSNEQLDSVLEHLQMWARYRKEESYLNFFKKLDKNLASRYSSFDNIGKLRICDLIYHLLLARKSVGYWLTMQKLGYKIKQLSLQQLVHYTALLNGNKKPPINMYELEYYAEKYLKDMNIQELALVALCFFKKKTQTRNPNFFNCICQKAIENIDEITSFDLAAIMKFIRSFRYQEGQNNFRKLLQKCNNLIPRIDILCCTHILHAAANMTVYEKKTIDLILDRFMEELPQVRVKDIERLSLSLNVFNFSHEHPIYEKIIEQFENPERSCEMKKHQKSLSYTLMHLAQSGVYPKHLLEKVMHPDFVAATYATAYEMGMEYLFLDQSIEIEVADYTGPRLSIERLDKLIKYYKKDIPFEKNEQSKFPTKKHDKLMMDVLYECRKILGDSMIAIDHILPHYLKADLIVALDKDNKPLPAQEILSSITTRIKYIPQKYREDEVKLFALILGKKSACISGSCVSVGFITSKMRQLERIGYIPILIPEEIWNSMSEGKKTYLESMLFNENPSIKVGR